MLVFTVFLLTASLIHCENEDTESKTKASGGVYAYIVHRFSQFVCAALMMRFVWKL